MTWNCKILACKFLTAAGEGTDADAIECFNYIVALKQRGINIRISNNSWGSARRPAGRSAQGRHRCGGRRGDPERLCRGQRGHEQRHYPIRSSQLRFAEHHLGRGVRRPDNRPSFSNYGATSVHLAAPGAFIFTTAPGGLHRSPTAPAWPRRWWRARRRSWLRTIQL